MNANEITYCDFHLEVILSTQAHFKLLSGVMTGKFTFVPLGAAAKLRFPLTPNIWMLATCWGLTTPNVSWLLLGQLSKIA